MLDSLQVTRVVAAPADLDRAVFTPGSILMRTAPEDVLIVGGGVVEIGDPFAIVRPDAGWSGVWVESQQAETYLGGACEWSRPTDRPTFAQGMVAHLPVKLWLTQERTLFVVPTALGADFTERTPAEWWQ